MTDRFTVRAVVVGLIAIVLAVVTALVWALAVVDLTAEQRGQAISALVITGATALGGLVGILTRTASADPNPAPLEPAEAPVEVAAAA